MHGMSGDEALELLAGGREGDLEKALLSSYKELESRFDFIVCEGTDFTGPAAGLDFDLNANIANALGAPVLAVVRGGSAADATAAAGAARDALARKRCAVAGVIVSRVKPEE